MPHPDDIVNGRPTQDPLIFNGVNGRFKEDVFLRMEGRILLHGSNSVSTLADEDGNLLLRDLNILKGTTGLQYLDNFKVQMVVDPGSLYEKDFADPMTTSSAEGDVQYPVNFTTLKSQDARNNMDPSAPFWFRMSGGNLQGMIAQYGLSASGNNTYSWGLLNPSANSGTGRTLTPTGDTRIGGTIGFSLDSPNDHTLQGTFTNATGQNNNRPDGVKRLHVNGHYGRYANDDYVTTGENIHVGIPKWTYRNSNFQTTNQFDDQNQPTKDNYDNVDPNLWEEGTTQPPRDYRIELDIADN